MTSDLAAIADAFAHFEHSRCETRAHDWTTHKTSGQIIAPFVAAHIDALAAAVERTAEAMHDYAVGGESEDGYRHTTTPWRDCPGPECVEARAALNEVKG